MALIDTCLGTAGGLIFWAFGMPNSMLRGALAALLNFIPFLGGVDSDCDADPGSNVDLQLPGVTHSPCLRSNFVLATLNFVTPWIIGRRMTLNPVVFTGKIFCDHIEPLAPVGEFLGD